MELEQKTDQRPLPFPGGDGIGPEVMEPIKKLITHFNKATKGRIVRAIAQYRGRLRTARELAQLVATLGADVELLPLTKPGQAQPLEIVLPNLG